MNTTAAADLALRVSGTDETIVLSDFVAVVAGYTGRDAAAVQHHIDELAAIGVAPPPEVPMFYPVESSSLSTAPSFALQAPETSGEIEPLYIRHDGRYYLGIASDHTDRRLETVDIGDSKRACPKPAAATVVPVADLEGLSLDTARARTWVDGRLYQDGSLDGLRTPADVVGRLLARIDLGDKDFVCLGGTLPLIGGEFVYGSSWRLELAFPDGTTIDHTYTITKGTRP
ncbi:DUF2848 family protein [Sinomonas albida]|uniref:DUF2848 family protein n=1 Tax=Sinomonas albida TaxID=369942 RepID=UPI0010A91B93|nr:DUF2848 family protein [Sinomonas albida]